MAELIQGRSPLSLGAELREALQEYPSLWLRIDGDAPMGRRFPGGTWGEWGECLPGDCLGTIALSPPLP